MRREGGHFGDEEEVILFFSFGHRFGYVQVGWLNITGGYDGFWECCLHSYYCGQYEIPEQHRR